MTLITAGPTWPTTWPRPRCRTWRAGRPFLCFFDEDRPAGEHLVVPIINRRIGFRLAGDLHKGKPTRTLRLSVHSDAYALDVAPRLRKSIAQFLLRNGVGQVAYKQLGSHLLLLFGPKLQCTALRNGVTKVPSISGITIGGFVGQGNSFLLIPSRPLQPLAK